jgi:pseudouridine-5'-phosphate glycosidase
VTPYVLARIAAVTAGDSVPANLALAEHNAAVAGAVAVAVAVAEILA